MKAVWSIGLSLAWIILGGLATAADEKPAPDVAKWIRALDADAFGDREQATNELEKIGLAAIPAIKKAALEGNFEVSTRSVDVLQALLKSSDDKTTKAARAALEAIAGDKNAKAADRAKTALPAQGNTGDNNVIVGADGSIQIGTGTLQIQAAPAGGFGGMLQIGGGVRLSKSRTTANGVSTTQVDEGEQKIKIVDDPNQGITVEVTKTVDGKKKTETFEAKNADELKKKHPEAHKLYEKHGKDGQGLAQIVVNGAPINLPGIQTNSQTTSSSSAVRRLATARERLEQLKPDDLKNASAETLAQIQKEIAALKKSIAELEKKLAEPAKKPDAKPAEK